MKSHFLAVTVILVFTLVLGTTTDTLAQAEPIKFGKIELVDLQMKTYDKDTSAEAVVLCDYGHASFEYHNDYGFQIRFERTIRIKILKKAGYSWATGEIPFYKTTGRGEEKIAELKGYTYNLQNGEIVKEKLTKEGIFTEQKDENWFIQKFTLPNVKEGSVVEYTYTRISPFIYNFQEWTFQSTIPVRWSEYRAVIPEYFNYKMQANGYEPVESKTKSTEATFNLRIEGSGGVTTFARNEPRVSTHYEQIKAIATAHQWIAKDVPAIRPEAYITTPIDYLTQIDFELSSTNYPGQGFKPYSSSWTSLNEQLLKSEYFGAPLKRAGFLKDIIAKIQAEHKEPLTQALTAYEFLRHYMTWNGESSIYSKNGTKKAFDTRVGNAADINLMLTAMLKDMGLAAEPVLVSTRSHGRILPYYAVLNKFNYVVTKLTVGDQTVLLDATDMYVIAGMLPTRCLNGIGRVIDAGSGDWISLEPKEKATELTSIQMAVNDDGELKGKLEKSLAGYDAWEHRKKIVAAGKDKHTENLKKEHPTWQIDKIDIINIDKCNEVLNEKYELTMADVCQKAGNTLYLKPMLSEALTESPFKLTERKYPVDFGTTTEKTYVASITIPTGFKVEEMPKNAVFTLPENSGRFSFLVAVNGNTIQVSSKLSLKKTVYYAEEYAALREFFAQIVSKHAEQIVLKKM
jgi:transglutaminase-like putative cysteine protease